MADALNLFPARVPFVDPKTGLLTSTALRAMQLLLVRVGGPVAPNINELAFSDDEDSGLEETRAELSKALDGLFMAPLPVPTVQEADLMQNLITQLAEAREQIASIKTELDDLKQGQLL